MPGSTTCSRGLKSSIMHTWCPWYDRVHGIGDARGILRCSERLVASAGAARRGRTARSRIAGLRRRRFRRRCRLGRLCGRRCRVCSRCRWRMRRRRPVPGPVVGVVPTTVPGVPAACRILPGVFRTHPFLATHRRLALAVFADDFVPGRSARRSAGRLSA